MGNPHDQKGNTGGEFENIQKVGNIINEEDSKGDKRGMRSGTPAIGRLIQNECEETQVRCS